MNKPVHRPRPHREPPRDDTVASVKQRPVAGRGKAKADDWNDPWRRSNVK